jgi:predicted MFS family arabinose efflux permease
MVFNIMLTFGFLPLKETIGSAGVFWIFGGIGVVCVALMYFYLPETKRVEIYEKV